MPTVQFLDDQLEGYFVDTPTSAVYGETLTFTCQYWDTPSSATATVYRSSNGTGNGKDVTATVMPSGSVSYGSTSATLKPLIFNIKGNATFKVVVSCTIGGETRIRMFTLPMAKAEAF